MVNDSQDVARQAIFHFSTLGYRLLEQQPDVCVFQRGRKWAGFWDTDIRGMQTILTVRTAPAAEGKLWVSCDWSLRTFGAWVTRRDIAKLEAEGRGLESLLGGKGISSDLPREKMTETPRSDPDSPPPQRPKLVPVLATMNLVGAILLMLVCAMEQPAAFAESVPQIWQVWEKVDSVLGFTMAAGLFAASIGLFLWKPWARKLTLGFCVFGLASFVFDAPYFARFMIPDFYAEVQQTLATEGVDPDALDTATMLTVVTLVGGMMLIILTWLIGHLVYFTRPRVIAAFESPHERPSRFLEWLFSGAGAIVGLLSVFGPLALLLGIGAMMKSEVETKAPPSAQTSGVGELLTKRDANAVADTIHRAAETGDVARVRQLLDAGGSVNAKDATGRTPLMKAVAGGHRSLALTLILLGADFAEQDMRGQTATMIAAEKGDAAFLSKLHDLSLCFDQDATARKEKLRAFPGIDRTLLAARDSDLLFLDISTRKD